MTRKTARPTGLDPAFPQFSFQMRGSEAIRVIYEGRDLGVFDISHLWEEYRKTIEPNDPNKRYVIERAIETLEGKIPSLYKQAKSGRIEIVPIWNSHTFNIKDSDGLRDRLPIRKAKKKNLVSRILAALSGIRF